MTFFTDFKEAIENYPDTGVEITITDLDEFGSNGTQVNTNDIYSFKVSVRNHGWLNMSNVRVHVNRGTGATVGFTSNGPWFNNLDVGPMDIDSGHTGRTQTLYFKAPSTTHANPVELVESHLNEWDANLNNLLVNKSDHSWLESGTYSSTVLAN